MGGLDGSPNPPDARQHPGKAVVLLDFPPRIWPFLSRLVIPDAGSILRVFQRPPRCASRSSSPGPALQSWSEHSGSGGLRGPRLQLISAPTCTRRAALRAIAGAAALAGGCGTTGSAGTVLRFWAMGREGEVVTELLPE